MSALAVALAFGLVVGLAGLGWARHFDPDDAGPALAAAGSLALLLVVAADVAASWRYLLGPFALGAAVILAGGWLLPVRRRRDPGRGRGRLPGRAWFLVAVAIVLAVPLLIFPVPLDTDAQGFGYLALMIRDGGTITSLAPWHPEISYLYTPGALLTFAAVSQLFARIPLSAVMMGVSHACAFFFVALAFEFGGEIGLHSSPGGGSTGAGRWSWAAGISAALSIGLWTALLDSHYPAVFALLFSLACLTSFFRFQRTGRWTHAGLAALFLAATAVSHPDMTIALGLGLAAVLALGWLAIDRPSLRRWLAMAVIVPLAALVAVTPWLVRLGPLIRSGLRSPFPVLAWNWHPMVFYQGLIWPALAMIGALVYGRRRLTWALGMIGWILLILDASTIGWLERLFPWLNATVFRFDYPFSLAWHAPILPYLALAAGAIVWVGEKGKVPSLSRWMPALAVAAGAAAFLIVVLRGPLLSFSKGRLSAQGAFATANDLAAMLWIRDHAPPDARVLNYPGNYADGQDWEAEWAPVLAERDSVYFRRQPFFLDAEGTDEPQAFLAFWQDPTDPKGAERLRRAGIGFVLVPESIGDPASWERAWRWKPPARLPGSPPLLDDLPYLQPVFRRGGAQVFQVIP